MTTNARRFMTNVEHEKYTYYDVHFDHDDIERFVIAYENLYACTYDAYVHEFERTHNAHDAHANAFHVAFNIMHASRDSSMIVANRVQHEHTCAHLRVCASCAHDDRMSTLTSFDTRVRDRRLTRRANERETTYTQCVHCASMTIRAMSRCIACYELHT